MNQLSIVNCQFSIELREQLLAGPDYFTCERMHTRMQKIRCLDRQEKGIPVEMGYKREIPSECADCPQGREIKAELQKKDQSTEDSMQRKTGICSECKKEKEIAARGMCKICYDTWRRKELTKHRSYSLATMGVNYGEEVSVAEESEDAGIPFVFKDINVGKTCLLQGCAEPQAAKGRCKKHYNEAYLAEKNRMKREGIMGPVVITDLRYLKDSKDTIEADDSIDMTESAGSVESTTAGETWIIVDFEQLPKLFEHLRQRAAQELRTPEQQALYFIREALHDQ